MKRIAWYSVLGCAVVPIATIATACGDVSGLKAGTDAGANADPDEDAAVAPVGCGATETCRSGRCTVTVPGDFAPGAKVTVAEEPLPASLVDETVASYVCVLTMPAAGVGAPVRLSLAGDSAIPDAILFRAEPGGGVAIGESTTSGPLIEALVSEGGTYGATLRPGGWSIDTTFANDPLSSQDPASLIRNLSLQSIAAAWFDGTYLYVGSGPRVLIYDGIPASPFVKPVRVLGQPTLDRIVSGTTASTFAGGVNAIWSDGTRLVVVEGNRTLIWNALPSEDYAPADLVLGQQDFVSSAANAGGVSAATLSAPRGVDSDGSRLVIADTLNHRVLTWHTFPTTIGQPASSVIGQPSSTVGDIGMLYQPWGALLDGPGVFVATAFSGALHFPSLANNVASDFAPIDPSYPIRVRRDALQGATSIARLPSGGLAMMGQYGTRIGVQRAMPTSAGAFDFVLGQAEPDRIAANPVSGSSVAASTTRVVASSGKVFVADASRLLVFDHEPAFNFDPADRVVGQAGFSVNDRGTDYRGISDRTLGHPADVAASATTIAVADRGNNRVVLYAAADVGTTNARATVVLGQPDATSFVPNVDQVKPSATTLSGPAGVAMTANHLVVADTENHRVLVWTPVPTATATPASYVLGQADFTGRRPNRGRVDADGDGYSDADADGFFAPTGVATDGTHLFVADRLNHRVLVWSDLATITNGKPADAVIGQATFAAVRANRGTGYTPTIDGFSFPTGVTLDGNTLWVADTENNRVVRWDDVLSTPVPSVVLGQPDGSSLTNPNAYPESSTASGFPLYPATTDASVLRPRSVVVSGQRVFVSETDSNRVHLFEHDGAAYTAAGQLGQPSATSSTTNAGGVGAASLAAPSGLAIAGSHLFVADSANHRVLSFAASASSVAAATRVLGQMSFVGHGFDRSLPATGGGATRPRGMFLSQGELLVAERSRHRVVIHELPLTPGKEPKRVLGQPDPSVALPNAGGSPSAGTLASPAGVFADDARIVIADTANHRVVIYPRAGAAAAVVIGQASFAGGAPNRGASAGAGTLLSPEGVWVDGGRLIVADTGNHRVLVWNTLPTADGQPADVVIGQASFASAGPNGPGGLATSTTLALPAAVLVDAGRLFVADSGNNRVLVFDAVPSSSGAAASRVLGQPDFSSRAPAVDINARAQLSGPVALASDGAHLYVADRDGNRIVAYVLATMATGGLAARILNASNGLVASGPAALAVARGPHFSSTLFVADTNKDQLLEIGGLSRLR
ncbi:MAG: hypothetical protein KF795_32645 [Labilithrix sp.]|nr:hypothetical protein [Labilithrix sp.]